MPNFMARRLLVGSAVKVSEWRGAPNDQEPASGEVDADRNMVTFGANYPLWFG
jgi:hypothetical protein